MPRHEHGMAIAAHQLAFAIIADKERKTCL